MLALPTLELDSFTPPTAVLGEVRAFNEDYADDKLGIPLETQEGQRHLDGVVARSWPELNEVAATARSIIGAGPGAVVIRGLGFEAHDDATRASLLLALTSAIGMPTDHALDRRVLWPIQERPVRPGRVQTFSERTGEAPFHTDSAFAAEPERYNGLYVIRRAACGGGLSRLVSAQSIIDKLERTPEGRECVALARTLRFPFEIPQAFYRAGPRVITAPILGDKPLIRFRPDAIENGFAAQPELATNEHRWAFQAIWEAIETHDRILEYMLQDGEFIVFDNHRLLHARGDFSDPGRHLVRIRMAERPPFHPRPRGRIERRALAAVA